MEKKSLDWANLGFSYRPTEMRYVANYKDGTWDEGTLTADSIVHISESAGVLHYCQSCFEGLKAYEREDGSVVVFRPDMNAERMINTATRLEMPSLPKERFLEAVDMVVKANAAWIPPYGSGASLYIRPYLFASGSVLGVSPATEYQFRLFTAPVGPYFKGGVKPLSLCVSDFDRVAPRGTGHVKAGLNYAMSIHPLVVAHEAGFDENLFLDPVTRTYVEETGGSVFLFITKEGEVVTPKSDSILPSITRRSLLYVAEHYLGIKVTERPVTLDELPEFSECCLCGTAAIVSPVGRVMDHDREICFSGSKDGMGPVTQKLYDTLYGIQMGTIKAPEGWIRTIHI